MRIRKNGVVTPTNDNPLGRGTVHVERTKEQKEATKLRKKAERKAHKLRVMAKHPPSVRYAKRKFKGGKAGKSRGRTKLPTLGIQ